MDDCELITLITAIACTISKCYSTDEISVMAVVFNQLGDTLSTVLVQKENRSKNASNKDKNNTDNCNEEMEK